MPDPISDLNADGRINADDWAMHDFAAGQPRTPLSNKSRLRVNLDRPSGSSTFHLFIDPLKSGRGLGVDAGPLDEIVLTDQMHADGTYTLIIENPAADVKASGGAVTKKATGRFDVIVAKGQPGMTLKYSANPGKRMLLRPGYIPGEEKRIITREAAKQLAPFGGIRFMDFLGTNGSKVTSPIDRPKLDWDSWAKPGYGAPVEAAIEICNVTGKDAWLCIPHGANDDYVREVAGLVKSKLRPDVNCYVELSNESWNSAPPFNIQRDYMLAKAKTLLDSGDKTLLEPDGKRNDTNAIWRWAAKRTVECRNLWGDDKRIRFVLCVQNGYNPPGHQARHALEYIAKHHGQPKDFLYAIGSAPYFGSPKSQLARTDLTPQSYLALLAAANKPNAATLKGFVDLSKKWGLEYVGYESNSHDDESGSPQAVLDGQMLPAAEIVYGENWNALLDGGMKHLYLFALSARRYWKEKNPPGPVKIVLQFGMLPGTHTNDSPAYRAAVKVAKAKQQ